MWEPAQLRCTDITAREMSHKRLFSLLILSTVVGLTLAVTTACTLAATATPEGEHAMEETKHDDEHEGETEHSREERIPNEGDTIIHIVAPADRDTISHDQDFRVEVDVENFVLGEDGNHWHISVDDSFWGAVEGGDTDEVLRGIAPGEHEISVFLGNGDREEFKDGDSIHITISE